MLLATPTCWLVLVRVTSNSKPVEGDLRPIIVAETRSATSSLVDVSQGVQRDLHEKETHGLGAKVYRVVDKLSDFDRLVGSLDSMRPAKRTPSLSGGSCCSQSRVS